MPLFQKSVLKKHILDLNTAEMDNAFQRYVAYFHNATIQQNIRNAKEEQFQEGFLRELFGNVLNYTLNPNPNFNLTTELKNTTNSKKADGAILVDEKAVAVIELKGTETTDLTKIEIQAFGYKNNQAECNYVITSNFEKLRFYIDNTIDFEEFNLFTLTRDQFSLLYLCLSYENIKNNIPKRLKAESVSQEDQITKKLYKDYSEFKRALYNNLVELNPQFDKLLIFKKTQKLLDRFLFIFFAEDTNLLPTNLIFRINKEWKNLQEMRIPVSLYDRYLVYFNDLNHGAKVTLPAFGKKTGEAITAEFEIFAYNGGLFHPDEILDHVKIDDTLLHTYSERLSHYDFDSDVDVNILGHIFENSLNEIDEIKSEIEGTVVDKTKTKRKKDGVFYTPKYITKYIVDNTVGKLCVEKKAALKLADEDYTGGLTSSGLSQPMISKAKKKALLDKLAEYRAWLLQLTICDPACGSGAFLNQALEFLIAEHRYVDELQAKLMGDALILSDIETSILENNIYGVDLNDESVEIAKLSLWLRTAQKGRKLNSLNKNIKCGNSLIDDPEVAGEQAFSWEKEFPEVFGKGGFDVVIGNPPYVKLEMIRETSVALENMNYQTFDKRGDLYVLFVEKGFEIVKEKGFVSYIMPNKWLQAGYGEKLRKYFLTKELSQLIDFGDIQIFEGATTYPVIFNARNNKPNTTFEAALLKKDKMHNFDFNVKANTHVFETEKFNGNTWIISSGENNNLLERLSKQFKTLKEFLNGEANYGIKPGLSEAFIISKEKRDELISLNREESQMIGLFLRGRNIKRYSTPIESDLDYLILAHFGSFKILEGKYPSIFNHLLQFESQLSKRGQCQGSLPTLEKPFNGQHHWLELDNNPSLEYLNLYKKPKIMYQKFQVKPCFIYDEEGFFCNDSMWIIPTDNKALLGILNSKMGWWLTTKYCTQIQNGCQLIWKYFGQIPIPPTTVELNSLVETMLELQKNFQPQTQKLSNYISSQYQLEKLSVKLSSWYELDFSDFIKELNKAIKTAKGTPLTKKDEFEWMELFEESKKKALELKAEIDRTDKEIDAMVYELYGLTEGEIEIVEGE